MKDGDWLETGEWKQEERGRRSDVERMVEQAQEGTSFYHACCDEPTSAQFPHAYGKLLEGRARSRIQPSRDVQVVVKIGPTGCGKTRSTYDAFWPDLFVQDMSSGSALWWDGYEGQTCLLLDDFDGSGIHFRWLLRLLDRYPVRLAVKGGFTYGVWDKVVITTNKAMMSWYPKETDISPLARRIDHIERYDSSGNYVTEVFQSAAL